ncbi:MAG: DUF501 domain-containing protein [Ilumatobacteraceae bacterium]
MDDREMVRTLLGREPRGAFEIVVRDERGWPVVIRNAPLLDDGTPMPTRYWLVGESEVRRVGHLEADGGVLEAERALDPVAVADAHERYASERDRLLPPDHTGPRPSGGVGGTRTGVKCLHAHYAWHLAGGDDPVGWWVHERLRSPARVVIELSSTRDTTTIRCPAPESGAPWRHELPVTAARIVEQHLAADDPPRPEDLANAIGAVEDHLDDLRRAHPELVGHTEVHVEGPLAATIARVEIGRNTVDAVLVLERDAAEDLFRTVVTEAAADRAHNPGLPADHVEVVTGAASVLVATMRRLHLATVTIDTGTIDTGAIDTGRT